MKKIYFAAFLLVVGLTACSNEKKEETTASDSTATTAVDSAATVAPADSIVKTDTTAFACACDKKCTSEEECSKSCGTECTGGK